MKEYIENIIPRLKEFSQSLDRKEVFVDIPWVLVDADGGVQKYIFKRNGELVMSVNGAVTIGKWEYLATARSLLIDRVTDKILLNQNFIDSVVMILNQDGAQTQNYILANEILLPDLNVEKYLLKLYYHKNDIYTWQLPTGEILEFHGYPFLKGTKVTVNMKPVGDAVFYESNKKYIVKNNWFIGVLSSLDLETDKGKITVEYFDGDTVVKKGNSVFQNGKPATDGKYRLELLRYIVIQDGKIIKTSMF